MHSQPPRSKKLLLLVLVAALAILFLILRITTSPAITTNISEQQKDVSSQQQTLLTFPKKILTTLINKPRQHKQQQLLNGVILYLYGGRWHDYFVHNALPRLDEYFLSCYPYPVMVFHEGASLKEKLSIVRALPKGQKAFIERKSLSASSSGIVIFDDVSSVWKNLPNKVSETDLSKWLRDPIQRKFQGRGYRIMCRFWHGLVWLRSSLNPYEFYWRLDTDSILTRPVLIDPFRLVFHQKKCVYGFNRLKGENPHVATGLFDTFKNFLKNEVMNGHLEETEKEECIRFVTVRSDGVDAPPSFWAPMYYNNFEMGTLALKRSEPYQRFFEWVDEKEPFGTFRYRWGDAPLHTLGILVARKCSVKEFCNVTFSEVPYRHAVTKIPPLLERQEECEW